MLRHSLRAVAVVASLLACSACGIKGPLYLPPRPAPDNPAAAPGAAPATTAPEVAPGPSSPPLPPGATPPVERKS